MLVEYLRRMREIKATRMATAETSYYTPLENLLNGVGASLSPRIVVTSQLSTRSPAASPRTASTRALPDFGFFAEENQDLRGLVEAKGTAEEVPAIAVRPQVATYLRVVPSVLVTNFRSFLLVMRADNGTVAMGPSYTIGDTEDVFWDTPIESLVAAHESGLHDFLSDILGRSLPISNAEELANVLARYATEARKLLARQPNLALDPLRVAMTQALGINFSGPHGEEFFRSSLIQTIFYGLFSAWTLWVEEGAREGGRFDWSDASAYLSVPVVGALFEAVATNRRLRDFNLAEPVRWAEDALNRVQRDTFFANFEQQSAIQYFYEPFLEAYDPLLREQLGVWYTPPDIVRYQVQRVDHLLCDELGIADGLADENVVLLDPCTGTSSYIAEAARLIYQRNLEDEPALAAAKTKRAITTRLYGFEIMPAPFVIAHLQMGRLAASLGSSFGPNERARIYLTNALTGWGEESIPRQQAFPELADEREAADNVKRQEPILVIIGNPPYYRYATMAVREEADLLAPYKDGLYRRFRVRKSTLDDLYIRFYRLAEWRIAERGARRGIVSFISNWSWLAGSSFPVMRERLIRRFDTISIDNLGGGVRGRDRREEQDDENFFTTATNPGIKLNVAISFLVSKGTDKRGDFEADVRYRRLWGTADEKRAALLQSTHDNDSRAPYRRLHTSFEKKWVLRPAGEAGVYDTWTSLGQLMPKRETGVNENRGGSLISIDRQPLEELRQAYTDTTKSDAEFTHISARAGRLMSRYASYAASAARTALNRPEQLEKPRIVRFATRAFDDRWLLWGGDRLLNRKRPDFLSLVDADDVDAAKRNVFLVACENARVVYDLPGVTSYLGDMHYQDPWAQFFPLRNVQSSLLFGKTTRPNLKLEVLTALCEAWGVTPSDPNGDATADELMIGESVFYHVLATMHTPSYRSVNEEALTSNWARIPIPLDREVLLASVALGRRIAELLRTDMQPSGVLRGDVPPAIRLTARPRRIDDGAQLRDPDDLNVTANYNGAGHVKTRALTIEERAAIEANEETEDTTSDIYWNQDAYWANVPPDVWEYQIGGFPVLRKWLGDRKQDKLGRPLKLTEVQQFSQIARRIGTLLRLGSDLDDCHDRVTASSLFTG